MPYAARTRESKLADRSASTEPWLNPAATTPLEQSALAREHSTDTALLALVASKMHFDLPVSVLQFENEPLLYATVAATKPRLAAAFTAAVAGALVNVSVVPTM